MEIRRSIVAAVGAWVVLASVSATPAAVVIEKVLPFATDRGVRVRVVGKGEGELTGKIVPAKGGAAIWEGSLGVAKGGIVEKTIGNLKPELWSPGSPNLYNLVVSGGAGGKAEVVRFGFRSFGTREGQFVLNGHPIFLCGIAINPPERDIPDEVGYSREFAYAYVKYLRSQHVNLIRMTFEFKADPKQQVWFDACDELGMMVDQGCYGTPPGSGKRKSVDPEEQTAVFEGTNAPAGTKSGPPEDFAKAVATYKEVFETYVRHPAVVLYVLSNEQPGPNKSKPEWHEFLSKLSDAIHAWDPTRRIIGNAGYGWGREGDVADLHRYWGWYYNSFLTYYNLRDTVAMFGDETDKQPFTFSECVGSFTSPLGSFNAIFRKQLAPQLGWTGHAEDQKTESLGYQAFMVKHALESFRTMREQNHRMAGLMPFTILFFNWEGIKSFDQMKAKPAMEQMGVSYSPVLTSIESWQSQVYAGRTIRPIVHVVNDAEDFSDLSGAKLRVEVRKGEKAVVTKNVDLPKIAYFQAKGFPVEVALPGEMGTGDYVLTAAVERGGKVVSQNREGLYVSSPWRAASDNDAAATVAVYDPSGKTIKALDGLGLKYERVKDLASAPGKMGLIIGEGAIAKGTAVGAMKEYVKNGGRVLVLAQEAEGFDGSWLPVKVEMFTGTATDPTYTPKVRPTADQQNVNPERPWHPVLKGVGRERLKLWSDYTGWDQSKKGFPRVYPVTHGFKLADDKNLMHTAIIADYEHGLEGIAIAEMFEGKGSVVMTGLDLVARVGVDPVADQVLVNLVTYLTAGGEREVLPLVEKPIVWGNYATERGVLTGPVQGLVYNCRWVRPVTGAAAKPMEDNGGAWNTHPGNPFVPVGVRAIGPYGWSTGASPREESKELTGTGMFCARVPAGRKFVVSKVENPGKAEGKMECAVNGVGGQGVSVGAGKTVTIRTPIGGGATNLSVRYTGSKTLVILETSFE